MFEYERYPLPELNDVGQLKKKKIPIKTLSPLHIIQSSIKYVYKENEKKNEIYKSYISFKLRFD